MAVVAAVFALLFFRRGVVAGGGGRGPGEVPLRNPFSLMAATKFGLVFAVVSLVVKLAQLYLPAGSLFLVAGLAGLSDVDAITLSMAEFALQGGDPRTAVGAIAVAAIANTLVKCGLVVALGSRSLRTRLLPATAAVLVVGLGALWFG
jgi:uncharacterized membrane protein (DUF4010 family)